MALVFVFVLALTFDSIFCKECPSPENVVTMEDVRDALHAVQFLEKGSAEGSTIPGTLFAVKHLDKGDESNGNMTLMSAEFGNSVILAFRAPTGFEKLIKIKQYDFLKHVGLVKIKLDKHDVQVSRHLYDSYKKLLPKLKKSLEEYNAGKRFIVTGYSLGGSMASLVALLMAKENDGALLKDPRSFLITFGQTRVGDINFAKAHDDVISPWRKFRFVYKGDPVTKIPPYSEWAHHSRAVYLGNEKTKISTNIKKRSGIASALASSNTYGEENDYDRAMFGSETGIFDEGNDDFMFHDDEDDQTRTLDEEKTFEESEKILNDEDPDDDKTSNNFNSANSDKEAEQFLDDGEENGEDEGEIQRKTNDAESPETKPDNFSDGTNRGTNDTEASIDDIGKEEYSELGSTESYVANNTAVETSNKDEKSEKAWGKSKTGGKGSENKMITDATKPVKNEDKNKEKHDQNNTPKFLQICNEKEDGLCVVKHENLISSMGDHDLTKYIGHLIQGPGEYLTRKGTRKFSLEEAVLDFCQQMKLKDKKNKN